MVYNDWYIMNHQMYNAHSQCINDILLINQPKNAVLIKSFRLEQTWSIKFMFDLKIHFYVTICLIHCNNVIINPKSQYRLAIQYGGDLTLQWLSSNFRLGNLVKCHAKKWQLSHLAILSSYWYMHYGLCYCCPMSSACVHVLEFMNENESLVNG